MRPIREVVRTFWEHVDRSGGPDACWPWTGCRSRKGYGLFSARSGVGGPRVQRRAHRLAYALKVGTIPAGQLVCHHCDNPPCCNPAHLFLGTHVDNVRDKVAKGRQTHGARNSHAKLTPAQVQEIRQLWAVGGTPRMLAGRFGCSASNVRKIVSGDLWRIGPPHGA